MVLKKLITLICFYFLNFKVIVYSEDKSLNPIGCGKPLSDFPVGNRGWQVGLNFFNIHLCGVV